MAKQIVANCSLKECEKRPYRRGYCKWHYQCGMADGSIVRVMGNFTNSSCRAENCDRRTKAQGYCGTHYARWLRRGTATLPEKPVYCAVSGCQKKRRMNGYCTNHNYRWKQTGDPVKYKKMGSGDTPKIRFWSKVAVTADDTRCWLWQGCTDARGYGRTILHYKRWLAHRLAWFFTYGVEPKLHLLHSCDNPRCVNPRHLREGTDAENIRDAQMRGRWLRGEDKPNAYCTNMQVRAIRQERMSGTPMKVIAAHFNVPYTVVTSICAGRVYANVH